ncbi:MAG: PP2C family protein-serine/threonine phosphatase [Oscillospiraceae bacterium]|nr:PP2C family protein-serine/threonine phosphatase [Oscillospiraceae bacterium]
MKFFKHDKEPQKRKTGKLRKKIIALITLTVFFTMTVVLAISAGWFYIEAMAINSLFNDSTSDIARTYFSEEEMKEYLELAKKFDAGEATAQEVQELQESQRYQHLQEMLNNLCAKTNMTNISLCALNEEEFQNYSKQKANDDEWMPLIYAIDGHKEESHHIPFGTRRPEIASVYKSIQNYYDNGVTGIAFKDNCLCTFLPIVSEDKLIGFIKTEDIENATYAEMNLLIILAGGSSILVILLLLPVLVIIVTKTIVSPINLVAQEAEEFKEKHLISQKLDTIKTKDEIQFLSEAILKMEIDINEYIDKITKITAEKERIGAELSVATQIQADMLPCKFPAFPDRKEFEIFASMTPAKEVGGDLYDFFLIDDNHLALVIGDVSGKGVPAALFMVISKTLLKNQSMISNSPKEILETVNNQLYESNAEGMFVTVWLGILEISTGKIVAVNGGHEYPAIRKKDGKFELFKDKHGMMVGAMSGIPYKQYEFQLEKGDTLFVYTDGVPEATNAQNELYGTDRMIDALNQDGSAVPEQILSNVRKNVDLFVADAPQFDDLTMLCIRYFGTEET